MVAIKPLNVAEEKEIENLDSLPSTWNTTAKKWDF
jgi:hypothetical protein